MYILIRRNQKLKQNTDRISVDIQITMRVFVILYNLTIHLPQLRKSNLKFKKIKLINVALFTKLNGLYNKEPIHAVYV